MTYFLLWETEVDTIENALHHRKGTTLTAESAASEPWVLAREEEWPKTSLPPLVAMCEIPGGYFGESEGRGREGNNDMEKT